LFLSGLIAHFGLSSPAWMWAFVALNAVTAATFGATLVYFSVVTLASWGIENATQITAWAVTAVNAAAFVGPLIMWYGLSSSAEVYLDPALNTSQEQNLALQKYASEAILILGGVACSSFFGYLLFVKPYTTKRQ